jgi:hypothetical protein
MNNKQLSLSELIEKLKCKDLNSFLEKLCNTFGNYKLNMIIPSFNRPLEINKYRSANFYKKVIVLRIIDREKLFRWFNGCV